ncbi:MAG TPA: DUF3500 domain-containing protein [Planctomycetaceae bacterium]|nr:DUF3500 domain-containing protein [Planctomycetaceae bacterium]
MKTHWKRFAVSFAVLGTMGALLLAQGEQTPASGKAMMQAAQRFRETLTKEQLAQASFGFDDPERLNWHFIPRPRKGLPLRDLEGAALKAAHAVITSGLSGAGYEQALNVMSLEEVLYLLETGDRAERRERRNPGKYYLSIFGTPSDTGKWGWRVEGHHLSLNYTLNGGQVIGSTPEFFGANPAFIDAGPGRSIRVLGTEEDLARQILKLCTAETLKVVHVDPKAPDDLRGGNSQGGPNTTQAETTPPVGLPASKMTGDQKMLLGELLTEYLKNMPQDVSSKRRARLTEAGFDNIYFAWWGDTERNQRHQYRVQGPTFIIEYNNTQNNANHVHSFWRDLAGDFGIPVKK